MMVPFMTCHTFPLFFEFELFQIEGAEDGGEPTYGTLHNRLEATELLNR